MVLNSEEKAEEEKWYKNAVIYAIDVERFCDSNGDGIGDFPGLTSKLKYLADLGITCLWILPFYPSEHRDNGYDVTDYFGVDRQYGTLDDFLTFLHRAGEFGLRVIMDLVVDHTSHKHPWFQAARNNEESRYRDYYYWSSHPPPTDPGEGSIFPGSEDSVWTYDEVARAFYHHRFYHYEPSLNPNNPDVREEFKRIIDYWMSYGISGFRIDAASHMVEFPDPAYKALGDPHDILREIYQHAMRIKPNCMMLGEVDESAERLQKFFDGEQLNMMFNFLLDNYLFLALASGKAEPVKRGLKMVPEPPQNGQWANFLRNLDELDLERLSEEERKKVFEVYAPKETMKIFGRGIRRRLAPMLKGNTAHLKMAFSLLFSMPGAPNFVYGDEIGLGEDLDWEGRNSVRSPMQWSAKKNAGFSDAPPSKLCQRVISEGAFGYKKVNVEAQEGDKNSLLEHVKKLCHLRRSHTLIGEGRLTILPVEQDHIFAHMFERNGRTAIMLHNLKDSSAKVKLEPDIRGKPVITDSFSGKEYRLENRELQIEMEPYGFCWLMQKAQ